MLTTEYHSPYALILAGGRQRGHRPRTKTAWIAKFDPDNKRFKVWIVSHLAWHRPMYKRPIWIPIDAVVKSWRHWPTSVAVERARRSLPVVT
jgi:hypothetical protein